MDLLTRGDAKKVYAIVRSVSRSGMQRTFDFYVFIKGEAYLLNRLVSILGGYRLRLNRGEVVVKGCGMDMGWAAIADAYTGCNPGKPVTICFEQDGYRLEYL